jgi:hypothetical protein
MNLVERYDVFGRSDLVFLLSFSMCHQTRLEHTNRGLVDCVSCVHFDVNGAAAGILL